MWSYMQNFFLEMRTEIVWELKGKFQHNIVRESDRRSFILSYPLSK